VFLTLWLLCHVSPVGSPPSVCPGCPPSLVSLCNAGVTGRKPESPASDSCLCRATPGL
jgi:hypothetical protein